MTRSTRQPTRYDTPSTGSGPVPDYADPDGCAGRLRLRADNHGGVSLELITDDARAVLVIDREDFAAWAEQVDHLRDRIRQGY